jgi:hypothetical protein
MTPTHPVDFEESATEIGELVRDVPVIIQETKEGYKTSEFWASIAAAIIPLLAGVPEKFYVPLLGAITVAYTLSRGLAKRGVPASVTPAEAPQPLPVVPTPSVD